MRFQTPNTTFNVSDGDEIGSGGEARVFKWDGKAVKVFYAPEDAFRDSEEEDRRQRLELKEEKVQQFPSDLPDSVVVPRRAVFDSSDRFRGYTMDLVDGHDLRYLSKKSWRSQYGVENEDVQQIFRKIWTALEGLHQESVIVGDFNDTNVVFELSSRDPYLIDTDSFQLAGLPCTVAHNRYLDPRLYEKELAEGPVFDEYSDWYSFSVLFFESILYVHPYGGTHGEHQTLLRRAEASHSVFNDDVRYPGSAVHWKVFPPAAIDWFRDLFDNENRTRPPVDLLEFDWESCGICGNEHARSRCPICTSQESPSPGTRTISGVVELEEILDTSGNIVHADGEACVYWNDGTYYREDGREVIDGDLSPEYRFRLSGWSTWMGRGGKAVKLKDGEIQDKVACDTYQGTPVFDTAGSSIVHLHGGWVVSDGTRIGKRVKNRTIFWTGRQFGLGFSQIGQATEWFGFFPDTSGLLDIDLPSLKGKILQARAVFDGESTFVSVLQEHQGRRFGTAAILDGSDVEGVLRGPTPQHRILGETRSITLKGTSAVVITSDGLITVRPDFGGELHEAKVFEDAEGLVSPGCRIFPGDNENEAIVAGAHKLYRLTIESGSE